MSLISLIILGAAVLSAAIGTFVFLHSRKRSINHAFFLFSVGTSLWIGAYGLIVGLQTDAFLPLLNTGGLILVCGLVQFALVFPTRTQPPINLWLFWAPLLLGGTSMVASNTIILKVRVLQDGSTSITHGPLIILWSLLLFGYILVSLFLFVRSYQKASVEDRHRLRIVYVGISLFVLTAIIFDAILPGFFNIVRLNQLGPLASLFFIFVTAYAIMRHQFMDIRVVIQRSIIYSLSFFLLTFFYIVLLLSAEEVFEGMANIYAPLSAGITIFIGIYTLPYMEAYFRRFTDPWFFKDRYDYFSVLESLSDVLKTNLNMRPLALQSLVVLERTFKPKYSYFIRSQSLTCYSHTDCSHATTHYEINGANVRIPIYSGARTIGEYVLGPKRSGDPYSKIDRSLMRAFAGHATVAFEKAELYQRLREHTDQLEKKIDERTKHLRDMQLRQRDFFDDISHALQTPLTILKSGFERLNRDALPEDQKVYSSMDTSIDDLSRLIRSILQLARIDTYSPEVIMGMVDFTDLVIRITEYVQIIAEREGISLSTNIPDIPIYVRGDEQQLMEACTNLLSNAVKYTTGSGIKKIDVSLTECSGMAVLSVKDTGMGMTADQLAKIFERFYRAQQPSRSKEGYGLGLAITKRIVERHNGSIRFVSATGEGTNVTVNLPVQAPEAPQQQKPL
ncbi:MAG: hypothetical protein JWL75_130 [Parcubacteria group bacterium]|nr:hypothetical protein [Parcubacteria group bacterium]